MSVCKTSRTLSDLMIAEDAYPDFGYIMDDSDTDVGHDGYHFNVSADEEVDDLFNEFDEEYAYLTTYGEFEEREDDRLAVEMARRREVHDYGTAKRGPIVCLHGVQKEIASKIAEMRDLYSGHLEIWDDIPFRSRLPIRKMARVRVMEDADPMRVEHRRRSSSWKRDFRARKAWAKHF